MIGGFPKISNKLATTFTISVQLSSSPFSLASHCHPTLQPQSLTPRPIPPLFVFLHINSDEYDSARTDNNPNKLFETLTTSPQTSMRRLSFAKELRILNEKKGGSRIFRKMSDVRQIGDIERVHRENRGERERKKSVDFDKIKYGRRGSLDYDSNHDYHEMRTILETAIGQKHLCQFMREGQDQKVAQFNLICMYCWIDCASFIEINNRQFRYTRAIQVR